MHCTLSIVYINYLHQLILFAVFYSSLFFYILAWLKLIAKMYFEKITQLLLPKKPSFSPLYLSTDRLSSIILLNFKNLNNNFLSSIVFSSFIPLRIQNYNLISFCWSGYLIICFRTQSVNLIIFLKLL
jgi:hypothetical protein